MDQYISYSARRREPWKGHHNEKGVRAAIAYAQRRNSDLTVFVSCGWWGQAEYVEIPPSDWAEAFAE